MKTTKLATVLLSLLSSPVGLFAANSAGAPSARELNGGWKLQSGCVAKATRGEISTTAFHPDGWIDAEVPGTVLGSQVEAGIFKEPFFGMNLRSIPGTDYPMGKIFGYLPMSANSPYRCSWWYRTVFNSQTSPNTYSSLHFDGINYRANIWLNGKKIASSEQIAGAFRSYDLDVTKSLAEQGENVLAVEAFAQTENDLGIDFLDWNPAPADKDLGLWRGVCLFTSGPVTLKHPAVTTHFTSDDLKQARLEIVVDVANVTDHAAIALITADLGGRRVQQSLALSAHQSEAVHFGPGSFPQLLWENPPIWWPYQYGDPHLEELHVVAEVDGKLSDQAVAKVGIREIDSSLNEGGYRQFRVNRRNILIRGGGWTPDMFYREPKERLREELTYVKQMNLNAIRLEGKLGGEAMFDLADEMGILIMAGWQCCDYWQKWDKWTPKDQEIAVASEYSQISRLRSHPSLLAWLNGSDEAPTPPVEQAFLDVLKERDWPNPVLSSAADRKSSITGESGVKMSGPYDYVPQSIGISTKTIWAARSDSIRRQGQDRRFRSHRRFAGRYPKIDGGR